MFALRSIVIFHLIIILLVKQLVKRQVLLKDLVRQILESAESGPLEWWAVIDDAGDGFIGEFIAPAEVELFEIGASVGDCKDGLISQFGGLGEMETMEAGRCDIIDDGGEV